MLHPTIYALRKPIKTTFPVFKFFSFTLGKNVSKHFGLNYNNNPTTWLCLLHICKIENLHAGF